MLTAVKPRGWLVTEEYDTGSQLTTDFTDPSYAPFTVLWRAFWDFYRKKGIVDGYFDRRVRSLMEGLGFVDVGHDGWCCTFRGGESGNQDTTDDNSGPDRLESSLFTGSFG